VFTMALPGFTAEAAVYLSREQYRSVMGGPLATGIVPALPSCAACESICDKCFDCLDTGKPFSKCPPCRVCSHCGSCSTGGGGGGGLLCCEFLQNPNPGSNCNWCGPTPFPF
jgi:hypothetical protein